MNREVPDPRTEPTVSIERAARILGISRSSAFNAVHAGQIPVIRLNSMSKVPTSWLIKVLGLEPELSAAS